jgi:hypothetical protein
MLALQLAIVVAWLGISGCARTIGSSRTASGVAGLDRGKPTADHITHAELAALDRESLDAALLHLRPAWLRLNPSSRQVSALARASIYIDDVYSGETTALRLVPTAAVMDAWYLTPFVALGRFGPGCRCAGGVILVQTRVSRAGAR